MRKQLVHFILFLAIGWLPFQSGAQTVKVSKSNNIPLYMHYMPWFETPQTSGNGKWGWHWTMNNQNPDIIDGTGKRQIASHYYPLIGPYASSDKDVIEYHLLLMKLAGIDGVLVDWYGSAGTNGDVGSLLRNSDALINKTGSVGLNFGLVVEDRYMGSVQNGQTDMTYAKNNYFNRNNYFRYGSGNDPLVGVFGPITFKTDWQWSQILSSAGEDVEFLPLWYQASDVGANADGEYLWIYQDQNPYSIHIQNYYANRAPQMKTVMGVGFPGYNDFYVQGNAGTSPFYIGENNGQTLASTLNLVNQYRSNVDILQLATFNDFGEGTMFEPTRETGFSYLVKIQQFTGVSYTENDLKQVLRLYNLRKQYASDGTKQSQLNQAFNYFVALRISDAVAMMDCVEGTCNNNNTLPSPWQSGNVGAVALSGSAGYSNGVFNEGGSGADIWGTNDQFRYIYQPVSGDATITARVASVGNTDPWAKAGVMIRETLNDNSSHASTVITPGNGINFQYRSGTSASSSNVSGAGVNAPYWVRIVRSGNTFTSYYSSNGSTWTSSGAVNIAMSSNAYIGLAVTSHNNSIVCNASFDNVSIQTGSSCSSASGISLNTTSLSLTVGQTSQLTATVAPSNACNKNINWTSSNTSIATVDANGLITAKATGTVTITATTVDQGKTASCTVNVTGGSTGTTYYRIKNRWQGTYLFDGGNQVSYGANPSSTDNNYQWSFEDVGGGLYEIKNHATGDYIHIEHLLAYVECTSRTSGWYSSRWTRENTGDGYVRFKNAWQSSDYIHIENLKGYAEYGAIDPSWYSPQWLLEAVTSTTASSILIQAENYTSMSGIQTESTSDAGAGLDVGWIDAGDWMSYHSINFPASGTYTVEYRVTSLSGGGSLSCDLNAGAVQLGAISVPSTGGWQNWTMITQTINVTTGTYDFGIFAQAGGWNINWFRITQQGAAKMASAAVVTDDVNETGLEIYPNPAFNELTLKFASDLSREQIKIVNALGVEVLSPSVNGNIVDISSLGAGIYTVIISKNGKLITRRFVKN